MRHFILAFAIFLVIFSVANIPNFANAMSVSSILSSFSSVMNTPFGGKITSTSKGNVTCTGGTGPISLQSANTSGNGKEYIALSSGNKTSNQVRNNAYILGNHQMTSANYCYTQVGPYRIPYTITPTNFYGVGK